MLQIFVNYEIKNKVMQVKSVIMIFMLIKSKSRHYDFNSRTRLIYVFSNSIYLIASFILNKK